MPEPTSAPHKPRSFTADSPFSLLGILIALVIGVALGGFISLLILF